MERRLERYSCDGGEKVCGGGSFCRTNDDARMKNMKDKKGMMRGSMSRGKYKDEQEDP